MREDLFGIVRAPREIEELLVRIGGRNPYSEPNYRVVLAQNRICRQAAEWHDWDDSLSIQERGGFVQDDEGRMVHSPCQPDRIVTEMRTIPRYPICECTEGVLVNKKSGRRAEGGDCEECGGTRGWIVERWAPAHAFAGSESAWYAEKVPGSSLPRLGPYPHEGEYIRIQGSKATRYVPTVSQLADLITFLEYHRGRGAASKEQYVRERVYAAEQAHENRRKKLKAENAAKLREALDPLVGNSLRAGAEREQIAQRMRARGAHIGHVGN